MKTSQVQKSWGFFPNAQHLFQAAKAALQFPGPEISLGLFHVLILVCGNTFPLVLQTRTNFWCLKSADVV